MLFQITETLFKFTDSVIISLFLAKTCVIAIITGYLRLIRMLHYKVLP